MTITAPRIETIELEERPGIHRAPLVEQTRAAAVRDILEDNHFKPLAANDGGPYHIRLGLTGDKFIISVRGRDRRDLPRIDLALSPFRRIVKDYFLICESYQTAFSQGDRYRLEAIDMARRGLHNEGARMLAERLGGAAETDDETARGLFTLLCVLHIGHTAPW